MQICTINRVYTDNWILDSKTLFYVSPNKEYLYREKFYQ